MKTIIEYLLNAQYRLMCYAGIKQRVLILLDKGGENKAQYQNIPYPQWLN